MAEIWTTTRIHLSISMHVDPFILSFIRPFRSLCGRMQRLALLASRGAYPVASTQRDRFIVNPYGKRRCTTNYMHKSLSISDSDSAQCTTDEKRQIYSSRSGTWRSEQKNIRIEFVRDAATVEYESPEFITKLSNKVPNLTFMYAIYGADYVTSLFINKENRKISILFVGNKAHSDGRSGDSDGEMIACGKVCVSAGLNRK